MLGFRELDVEGVVNRTQQTTARVETDYGAMYVHVDHVGGLPVGGGISHPRKNEHAAITKLVEQLAQGIDDCLKDLKS